MRRAQIAVLTLALGAGGIAAVLVMRSGEAVAPPPAPLPQGALVDILVTKTYLEVGRRLTLEQVQWQPWPATATISEYFRQVDNPGIVGQIAGSITRGGFTSGEPILKAKVIRADGSGYMAALIRPGMRAIATDITPEAGVGGFILPNDQTVEEKNGQRVVIGKIATLELAVPQAEMLALARRLGSISLMLRGLRELEAGADDDSRGGKLDRADSVSVVRFGRDVPTMLR